MALYAVIDAAAAKWLYPAILAERDYQPLFAGALNPDLAPATPHLVRLAPDSALLARMTAPEGRAQFCGILCDSELTLWDLRLWLRRKLQVILPDTRVVLFRFYDPRVFAPYVEALTQADWPEWFGPPQSAPQPAVSTWWVPLPEATLGYRIEAGHLARQVVQSPTPA